MRFTFAVAFRYIFASRGDAIFGFVTLFSVIGIAVGIAAINLVQAANTGWIEQALRDARSGLDDLVLRPIDQSLMAENAQLLAQLDALGTVQRASAFVEGQAAATLDSRTEPILLKGVADDQIGLHTLIDPSPALPWIAALPVDVAQRLGSGPGVEVEILSADGQNTALGWTPRSKHFLHVGNHRVGEGPVTFTTLDAAQIYLRAQGQWSGLALDFGGRVPTQVEQDAVQRVLAENGVELELETWKDVNPLRAQTLVLMNRVMFIVLALIMVIAGFNIFASQLMLVREKRLSIAVFRTMGSSRGQLTSVFVMIGMIIGAGGILGGLLLTLLLALVVPMVPLTIDLDLVFSAWNVGAVAIAALIICLLSTLYPAMRAAAVDPAIALRDV